MSRLHGGDGLWLDLEDECFGWNQAQCAIEAYLFPAVYAKMTVGVSLMRMQDMMLHGCI